MTHREHVLELCVFALLLEKRCQVLTLEACDFIHSWTCQTESTQQRVNAPVVHPSKGSPWQLYIDRLLTLPPTVTWILPFPCISAAFTSSWSEGSKGQVDIYLFCEILFLGIPCLFSKGADFLVQWQILLLGNFLNTWHKLIATKISLFLVLTLCAFCQTFTVWLLGPQLKMADKMHVIFLHGNRILIFILWHLLDQQVGLVFPP